MIKCIGNKNNATNHFVQYKNLNSWHNDNLRNENTLDVHDGYTILPIIFSHKNESKLKKIICWVIRSKNFFQMTLLYLCHISNWCYTWNKKAISRNTIILAFLENSSDARKNVQFYVLGEYMFKQRTDDNRQYRKNYHSAICHAFCYPNAIITLYVISYVNRLIKLGNHNHIKLFE